MKEQAHPRAPPSVSATPNLYMTPHLAKRKDGLCPSLLIYQGVKKDKPGFVSKQYQTNSNCLLQINERTGVPREVLELQTIVESINEVMKVVSQPGTGIGNVTFKHQGSIWKLALDPELNGASKSYKIEVTCLATSLGGEKTNYVIDTVMVPRTSIDPDPLAPDLPGFNEAKEILDSLALKVRKSIVRLEFPSFPEGCKGVPFRDVYQLNARVSTQS
jgi:hypothetical protein